MQILLARTAGFCMGVRRAMDMAREAGQSTDTPVFTDGPLIHNTQAVDALAACGVTPLEDAAPPPGATVILRAHGIGPRERERLEGMGVRILDATCPHVLANHNHIRDALADGRSIVVAGDPGHPEVLALLELAGERGHILQTAGEMRTIALAPPIMLIAQTTFGVKGYAEIVQAARERFPDCAVYDSICSATQKRQKEAEALASRSDALVVVGGHHSANTRRLAEIGRQAGIPTFPVETPDELSADAFEADWRVGVTAGASTPDAVTQNVIDWLRQHFPISGDTP